jgi:putative ABC transport system permease protein
MRRLRGWVVRVSGLFSRQRQDRELDEEIEGHIQSHIEENLRLGMTPEEARRQAMIRLGGIEATKEAYRQQRGLPLLDVVFQDVLYGARMLRKNPGFTTVAVLTLGLGIGSCTAIFSLINAALLRELPFPKSDNLVVIWAVNPGLKLGMTQVPPANADIAAWREPSQSFLRVAAFAPRAADVTGQGDTERVGAAGVTAGLFETLGVAPMLGRTFTREEGAPGGSPAVMIGHGLWQRRFGGDPSLLGKAIIVNGDSRLVIGILPPAFDFPRGAEWPAYFPFAGKTEVWLPLAFHDADDGSGWSYWQSREERGLVAIGRLHPGTGVPQAQAEMNAFAAREANDHPDTHKGWRLKVIPLREQFAGKYRAALLTLFAAVGLLLLIACVNIANLLLVRGAARRQEMAMRTALGAGRVRLIRQLLTECLLLAGIGSAVGVLVAEASLRAFLALNPDTHSRLDEASLDLGVLAFTALVALLTSLAFGLVPSLEVSRFDLRKTLDQGGRGTGNSVGSRLRGALVSMEVALALILLTTAGLITRSFLRVQAVQPGYRSDSVLAFDLQLPGAKYPTGSSQADFLRRLTERLEALPGVSAVGGISYLPLSGGENMGSFVVEGGPPLPPGNAPTAERRWVTPRYFATMGISVRQGRVFTSADTAGQPAVVVINDTLARQFLGIGDPTGHRLSVAGGWRTVVGVVSDVKSASLESAVRPQIYLPYEQDPWPPMTVVLHTERNPLALAPAVRAELKQLDALVPAAKMRTMEQVVSNATATRRFSMALLTSFAFMALLLTTMGIYGVVAFLAGRRVREIGVRMALGAQPRDIVRLILGQGMKPVVVGSLGGVGGGLAASRLVASQLYGVSAFDPVTLALIPGLLFGAALLACWLPAQRAANVDPMVALRDE